MIYYAFSILSFYIHSSPASGSKTYVGNTNFLQAIMAQACRRLGGSGGPLLCFPYTSVEYSGQNASTTTASTITNAELGQAFGKLIVFGYLC
jgi:hypothetical protein